MTETQPPQRDRLLEGFLDGLLNDAEHSAFVESLRTDAVRREQVELQARIDVALARLFHIDAPSQEEISAALARAIASDARATARPYAATTESSGDRSAPSIVGVNGSGTDAAARGQPEQPVAPFGAAASAQAASKTPADKSPIGRPRLYWAAAGVAAAAAVVAVVAGLPWSHPEADAPYFTPRPVADIYHDAVAAGFEPSYDCREPERFAAAFEQRQGVPLKLLAMPGDMRMLGLAYVGGLSRQTTAMLCEVQGKQVMVFVDRQSADQSGAAFTADPALRVFRAVRDGLVFYEVTPLDAPRAMKLIVPLAAREG